MFWLISIITLLLFILCLILLSVIVVEVDTRIPGAGMRWGIIGKARIWYDDEWWLGIQVLFYRKNIRLAGIKRKNSKPVKKSLKIKPKKKLNTGMVFKKVSRIIKTIEVTECRLAIDTNDYVYNAQLYPLNFIPVGGKHIFINFNNENYLVLKVMCYPWKMLYGYFKK